MDTTVAIIGSGFSGIGLAIRLRQEGVEDFVVLERNDGVGGTWWANTYPGCACDVPSHLYSFSFAPNPDWTRDLLAPARDPRVPAPRRRRARRDAARPARHRGARRALGRTSAGSSTPRRARCARRSWSAPPARWSSPGCPTSPASSASRATRSTPPAGTTPCRCAASAWRRSGPARRRSSSCPGSRPRSSSCTSSSAPRRGSCRTRAAPITRTERRLYRLVPPLQRLVRGGIYTARELLVLGFVKRPPAMRLLERVSRRHMARQPAAGADREGDARLPARLQAHPAVERLVPRARARERRARHRSPSPRSRERGVVTADGTEREVDAIVFGTGFHVIDMPIGQMVAGRDGRTLADVWDGSPRAHLGCTVPGFPNLFILLGPNTGLGHSSMVYMIESQVEYVLDALREHALARAPTPCEVRERGRRSATTRRSGRAHAGHGVEHGLRELVPGRARAATRRCGRTGRGASAGGRRASTRRSSSSRRGAETSEA